MEHGLQDAGSPEPLRVLWLIDSLTLGGAERCAVTYARALRGSRTGPGVRLEVATVHCIGGNPLASELTRLGVACQDLRARNLRDVGAYRRLLRLLESGGHQLIHAHLTAASLWGALASRCTGIPLVASYHVGPGSVADNGGPLLRSRIRAVLRAQLLDRYAACVLTVSRAQRQALRESGLVPEGALVLPNGVELPDTELRETQAGPAEETLRRDLGVPAGRRVLATVAVLRPGKGVEVVLQALPGIVRDHPDVHLVVVGDGPERSRLEAMARAQGLEDRVTFTGRRSDVDRILHLSELLVHPTYEDAFPTVVLEAMAVGRAVVASRVGGIPEMVESGVTGLMTTPGDAQELRQLVTDLLGDVDRRGVMGRAARRRVEEEFSASVWARRLERIYRGVLAEERPCG